MKTTDIKRCLLAADSGGSKTEWRLLAPDGTSKTMATTPGMASLHDGILPVEEIASSANAALGNPTPAIIYLSLGGPNVDEIQRTLAKTWPDSRIVVEREASGALIASCGGFLHCDAAVLAGTGVTAVGFGADGAFRYAEGWGPVFGDIGSGGGIGLQTVQTFLRGVDGTDSSGRLPELFADITDGLNIKEFAGRMELKRRINAMTRKDLAALAPRTAALAAEGDAVAERIIDASARAMAELAGAVSPNGGTILMLGGLFKLGEDYRERCRKWLSELRPDCQWKWDAGISMGKLAAARAIQLSGTEITTEIWSRIINE